MLVLLDKSSKQISENAVQYVLPDDLPGYLAFRLYKIQFQLGHCPRPCWGSYDAPPYLLVSWRGGASIFTSHHPMTPSAYRCRQLWHRGSVPSAVGTVVPPTFEPWLHPLWAELWILTTGRSDGWSNRRVRNWGTLGHIYRGPNRRPVQPPT